MNFDNRHPGLVQRTPLLSLLFGLAVPITQAAEHVAVPSPSLTGNLSFHNEIQHAIDRGLAWLTASHTMTKALTIAGVADFQVASARSANWRQELAQRLINLQQRDGSWFNEDNRWREMDPTLVTCYVAESVRAGMTD